MASLRGTTSIAGAMLFLAAASVIADAKSQLPLPYSSANFDNSVEATKDSSESVAASPNYLQHYEGGADGYHVQSPTFEGYLIPAMTTALLAQPSESHASVVSTMFTYLQPAMGVVAAVLPKVGLALVSLVGLLLVGTAVSLFFCAHTSLCHMTFMGFDVSRESMRSYITHDRVAEVAHFLQNAVKKYQEMNKKVEPAKKEIMK